MNGSLRADLVVARDDELDSACRFIREIGDGPGVLLLEGEPGVGKTTIWEAALSQADESLQVLSARPAEAEMKLSFAALGDLVASQVENIREELPDPQRRALEVALLLAPGGGRPPERRAVALGLLGALRALARKEPLLIAIDDVQWLDPPTAAALTFALRRLRDEPIRLLLTQRTGPDVPVALSLDRAPSELAVERIGVGPLSLAAVQRLLREQTGAVFTRPTLRRIHQTSGGNPFFALELSRALDGRSPGPGEPLPVPDELHALVGQRLDGLPGDTADLLLAAALIGQPTIDELELACGGEAPGAMESAVEANVLRVEAGQVRFTHPLLASAVVEAASEGRRRATHRRLADSCDEPEQRVRHLALAAHGPDEAIAEALAQAAVVLAERGAPEAAAELAEQARRLTPAALEERHALRTVDAGAYAWLAGEGARALRLLQDAAATAPTGRARAQALNQLANLEVLAGNRLGVPELCETALAQAGSDRRLRSQLHSILGWSLILMRRGLPKALRNARLAVELADDLDDVPLLVDALPGQAHAEFLLGGGLPSAPMQRALALHSHEIRCMRLPQAHFAFQLMCSDRLSEARSTYGEVLDHALAHGDESGQPWVLMRLSEVELLAGDWKLAWRYALAGHEQAVQSEQPALEATLLCTRALVAAHLGLADEACSDAARGLAITTRDGDGIGEGRARRATGLIELSLGHPAAAAAALSEMWDANRAEEIVEPGENRYLGDLVEALIELGRLDEAEEPLAALEHQARRLARPAALAVAERCRGFMAAARGRPGQALGLFEGAVRLHDEVTIPFERARTLLALGSMLRRQRRKRDARATLTTASAVFADLGAELWRRRAQAELDRIGGRAPSTGELTPSEERVAELVATGLTNREVAEALVVAERTVESHLSHVYRKLGLRSRAELAHSYSTVDDRTKVP